MSYSGILSFLFLTIAARRIFDITLFQAFPGGIVLNLIINYTFHTT